jgi:hypothetical protein
MYMCGWGYRANNKLKIREVRYETDSCLFDEGKLVNWRSDRLGQAMDPAINYGIIND